MNEDYTTNLKCQQRTNIITLVSQALSGLLAIVFFLFSNFATPNIFVTLIFYISLWAGPAFDAFSCLLLYDAFRRMKKYEDQANITTNTRMMHIHVASFALFVVSLFFFYTSQLGSGFSKQFVTWMTFFLCFTSLISQLLFIYILNKISDLKEAPQIQQ